MTKQQQQKHWILCFWLVSTPEKIHTEMDPSRTRIDRDRKVRWPSLPAEAPTWLRSLSIHRHHRPAVDKSAFVLPKLMPSHSIHNDFHPLEEDSSSESNNNDGIHRIVLPPLMIRSPSPVAVGWVTPSDKSGSWLLPAVSRKEVYRQVREQRQLSAKVARLPPLITTPPPTTLSGSHSLSSSAPPPRSPRGVEGTSVTLLSSRSVSRATMRIEREEEEEEEGDEEEVKIPTTTANGACARNPNEEHVHLWTARPTGSDVFEEDDQEVEEEEENDEMEGRKENGEKVALLPGALSGHSAVDESPARTAKLQVVSRDPSPPSSTLTAVQWTIEWTPRVDVPYRTSTSDVDEIEEEMAAPWTVERHWRSAKVRHSPPPEEIQHPPSPPVPALRAKTAHPSMSIELRSSCHREDDEEIIEEIENIVFQDDDIDDDDDNKLQRLKEEDDEETLDFFQGDQLFGVPLEQLKKLLHASGATGNNNQEETEDAQEITSSSPTFRRHPSEEFLVVPDCLPNAIQHPDDRPIAPSKSPRVVHSPVEQRRRPVIFDQEYPDDDDDADDMDNLRLPVKSRSVASFASNPQSPDENARRQRSLPTRRQDLTITSNKTISSDKTPTNGIKRMGLMPSSTVQRRQLTNQPPQTATSKLQPEPLDPRSSLQLALKNINSSEWEVKVDGIRRLEDLIATNTDVVQPDVHVIVLSLIVEIKNLRSQVSRAAIQSMGKMFQYCGRHMEQDLDRTVPLLLNKVGDTNRFIRDDAHAALMNVTEYVSSPKAIVVIVTESLTHKNATVRAEAAKLLAAIVAKMGPAKTLSGAKDVTEKILPAAAHFLQDGSLEARAQAKKIFITLMADPVFDKAMQKYLSPTVIRNIQRTLDQLRKSNH